MAADGKISLVDPVETDELQEEPKFYRIVAQVSIRVGQGAFGTQRRSAFTSGGCPALC